MIDTFTGRLMEERRVFSPESEVWRERERIEYESWI
jgi:hypothetical protein